MQRGTVATLALDCIVANTGKCFRPVLRKIEHIDNGFVHALVESNLQVYKVILQFRMFVAILLLLK